MTVLISLVITVYHRERFLGAAIESILAQTQPEFELLVWNDGSTDRFVKIAQGYAQQDWRVRVVVAQHQGRSRDLKDAIAQTTDNYIGFVDSDDILASTALDETAAVLDAHPTTGLVYTDYLVMNERGELTSYGNRCRLPYSPVGLLRQFMTFHFRLIHALQTRQGINSTASSQSRLKPTARDRAILVHFNGLELLARSLNSGRVSGKRISPAY